jgi:hypothetical protein
MGKKDKAPPWYSIRDPKLRAEAKRHYEMKHERIRQDGNAFIGFSGIEHRYTDDASKRLAFLMAQTRLPPLDRRLEAVLVGNRLAIRSRTTDRQHFVEGSVKVVIEYMTDCEYERARRNAADAAQNDTPAKEQQ